MTNFIEKYWENNSNLWNGELITRFPPEPNGLLHLGHAKAINISYNLAKKYNGKFNLRMDDTNPEKEDKYFEDMIVEMVKWLGVDFGDKIFYASDYFPVMYSLAKKMIEEDLAYIDFSSKEDIKKNRGDLYNGGVRSSFANNSIDWHLSEFEKMKNGIYSDGDCVLRAKLDMSNPNINMRDPVLYRIKKLDHVRTSDEWCIYPSYDFAHPIEDWLEKISISLCTLEFEDHKIFYDYIISLCEKYLPSTGAKHYPIELEFSKLELDRGFTSKRKINALVNSGLLDGFDDPRLLTLVSLRRRGFTPNSIKLFCEELGVSKSSSITSFEKLEEALRKDLDDKAIRRIVVSKPILMTVINSFNSFSIKAPNHPKLEMGERDFVVSSKMWIEEDDIRLTGNVEKGFKRVEIGAVFRIMYTGLIYECVDILTDENGEIKEVLVNVVTDKKPRAAIHGLSVEDCYGVEILESEIIPCENSKPDDFLKIKNAYCEKTVLNESETFHAIRYGYLKLDVKNKNRLILTTKLKGT